MRGFEGYDTLVSASPSISTVEVWGPQRLNHIHPSQSPFTVHHLCRLGGPFDPSSHIRASKKRLRSTPSSASQITNLWSTAGDITLNPSTTSEASTVMPDSCGLLLEMTVRVPYGKADLLFVHKAHENSRGTVAIVEDCGCPNELVDDMSSVVSMDADERP